MVGTCNGWEMMVLAHCSGLLLRLAMKDSLMSIKTQRIFEGLLANSAPDRLVVQMPGHVMSFGTFLIGQAFATCQTGDRTIFIGNQVIFHCNFHWNDNNFCKVYSRVYCEEVLLWIAGGGITFCIILVVTPWICLKCWCKLWRFLHIFLHKRQRSGWLGWWWAA